MEKTSRFKSFDVKESMAKGSVCFTFRHPHDTYNIRIHRYLPSYSVITGMRISYMKVTPTQYEEISRRCDEEERRVMDELIQRLSAQNRHDAAVKARKGGK